MVCLDVGDVFKMGIMDGVISVIAGVIGLTIIVGFIASMNRDNMDTSTITIVTVIPVFFGLMILYGVFRMLRGGKGASM